MSPGKFVAPILIVLVALLGWLWLRSDGQGPASVGPTTIGSNTADPSADTAGLGSETAEAVTAEFADGDRADVGGERVRTGVRGRIVDSRTREPLAGVEVLAMRRPPGFERLMSRFRSAFFEGNGFWAENVPAPEVLAKTTTGPNGEFEMFGIDPGVVFLDGRADYTFVRTPKQIRIARGEVKEGIELVGSPSGRIRGVVYAPDGLPASGVAVNVRPGLNAFLGQVTQRQYRWLEAVTDAEGRYDLPGVPEGHGYTLSAAGSLLALAEIHGIDVEEGKVTTVDVEGQAGAKIVGRVLDVDGTPCVGANVAMVYLDVSRVLFSADGRDEPVTTDAEGKFYLERVAAGRIAFIAGADGRASSGVEEIAVVDGGVYDDFELVLREGDTLGGLVVDDEGRPIAGAKVEVRPMERPNSPDVLKMLLQIRRVDTETGPDGRFLAEGITARRVFLQASKPGYVTELRMGHDREKEDDVRITLSRGATVHGRVVAADGTPVTRFRVDTRSRVVRDQEKSEGENDGERAEEGEPRRGPPWRRNRNRTMRLAEGQTMADRMNGNWREFQSDDGRFEITGIPPGKIRVRVRAEGYRHPENHEVVLAAGDKSESLDFTLDPGAVARGRVIDAATGDPVSEAQVTAYRNREGRRGGMFRMNFDPQDMDFMGMMSRNSVMTDAQGSFEIVGLGEGDYRFTARHPDRAKASVKDVAIVDAVAAEDIVIELESGGGIEGLVTGRGKLPLGDAMIVAFSISAGSFKSASTDREGNYRIEGLPAGQYVVFKSKIGERAMNLAYDLLGNMRLKTVRVRKNSFTKHDIHDETDNSVRVWGVVRDGGEPVSRGMVTAMSVDGEGIFGMSVRAQPTDENGRFELIGLEPGEYFFQVSRFRGRPQQANLSIEVPEGAREYRVDLDMPQSKITGRVVDTAGNPIAGIMVRAGIEEGGIDDAPGLLGLILKNGVAQDRTDDDGRFELDKVAAGVYRISAGGQRGRRVHRKYGEAVLSGVEVDGNLATEELVLTVPLAGTITGVVLDGSGNPVPGAEIHYNREDGPKSSDPTGELVDLLGIQARPERSDENGRFELDGITPGTYRVRADADGLAPGVSNEVVIGEQGTADVQISVVRGATLRVRARNIDGNKIPFASISVLDGEGKPLASKVSVMSVFKRMMGRNEKQKDTGWYEVGSVPPDTYTVVITEKGQPEVRVTKQILDGETIEWDIDATQALEAAGRDRK